MGILNEGDKICKFFLAGKCKIKNCLFLHSLQTPAAICRFFQYGKCLRGNDCHFRHERLMDDNMSQIAEPFDNANMFDSYCIPTSGPSNSHYSPSEENSISPFFPERTARPFERKYKPLGLFSTPIERGESLYNFDQLFTLNYSGNYTGEHLAPNYENKGKLDQKLDENFDQKKDQKRDLKNDKICEKTDEKTEKKTDEKGEKRIKCFGDEKKNEFHCLEDKIATVKEENKPKGKRTNFLKILVPESNYTHSNFSSNSAFFFAENGERVNHYPAEGNIFDYYEDPWASSGLEFTRANVLPAGKDRQQSVADKIEKVDGKLLAAWQKVLDTDFALSEVKEEKARFEGEKTARERSRIGEAKFFLEGEYQAARRSEKGVTRGSGEKNEKNEGDKTKEKCCKEKTKTREKTTEHVGTGKREGENSELDTANMLKLSDLQNCYFPHVSSEIVEATFRSFGCDVETTLGFLSSQYGRRNGETVDQGKRFEKIKKFQAINKMQKWVETGDNLNCIYSEKRRKAIFHAEKRNKMYSRASEAFRSGNRKLASDYSEKAKMHDEKMKLLHFEASEEIYSGRNKDFESSESKRATVDLHGLHKFEAVDKLRQKINDLRKTKKAEFLDVLCGTGHHTTIRRRSVLLQTVCDYLSDEKFDFRLLPAGGKGGAVRLYFN